MLMSCSLFARALNVPACVEADGTMATRKMVIAR